MALVKFGGGIAAMAGKVGGTVFARNKAGAYSRNWAFPTNTPTPAQTAVRTRFGNQSSAWNALTDNQRKSWNALALTVTRVNRLGDTYVPTGRQIFLESANNLENASQPSLANAPELFNPPDLNGLPAVTATATAGILTTLSIADISTTTGDFFVIDSIGPISPVKNNLTNVYRSIGTANPPAPFNIAAQYIARFGNVAEPGQQIWFRVKSLSSTTGLVSPVLIFNEFITGT